MFGLVDRKRISGFKIFQLQITMAQNASYRGQSPKFMRRSMSPVDYINTKQYRTRLKDKEIRVEFNFIPTNRIEKVSAKRRDHPSTKSLVSQKTEEPPAEADKGAGLEDNSFMKTGHEISGIEKWAGRLADQTNDTDFLRVLDEDSEILKTQINLHQELIAARKKIAQLETELQLKNTKVDEQAQQIRTLHIANNEIAKKAERCASQLSTTKIKMVMQRRRNWGFMESIKKLKESNAMKRTMLDRIMEKQRKLAKIKEGEQILFELSPEKE